MRASARHAGESSGERHARVAQSWPSGASSGKNGTCRGTAGGRAGESRSGFQVAVWTETPGARPWAEALGPSPRCGRLRVIPVRGEFPAVGRGVGRGCRELFLPAPMHDCLQPKITYVKEAHFGATYSGFFHARAPASFCVGPREACLLVCN